VNTYVRFALSVPVLLTFGATTWGQSPQIRINEVLASNQTLNNDPQFGEFSDWIELYNSTYGVVNLSGYYVTDDPDEPLKWRIPDGTLIPGGGFLLLWADGRNTGLHTSFRLDKEGEQLRLYTPEGVLVDTLSFGTQQDEMSYGRLGNDPSQCTFFSPPSPGAMNNPQNSVSVTPQPIPSIPGGFYQGTQVLRFGNAGQIDIYYTLDGAPPDDSASRYYAPITLTATTPVRAIGYKRGSAPSGVVTHTYFINEPTHLPVVSIVTDPDNFFSNERGIYVTGTNGIDGYCDSTISNVKQDWERPVNIEFYETDGSLGFNQPAGVKIHGGCSRHRYPQRSLALFARKEYGKGSFQYQLFPDKDIDRFESFVLRNSGDDQVFTMFRDALSQMVLVEYMDVDVQDYRPVVLFINGRYWGIHNLREKINEHYVAENFGVDPDEVNLLGGNGVVLLGTDAGYAAMVNYANTHNMADPKYYEVVKAQMDIDQYIDYQIGHIHLAEGDWPGNNIKYWRTDAGSHTRWRWINYDMDYCFKVERAQENMIDVATTALGTGWPNPDWSTRLLRNLLKNEGFHNEFIQRYAYHLNTTFDPERLLGIIDQFQGRLAPEIPRHITRWGGRRDPDAQETWMRPTFNSVAAWEQNVDEMRDFAVRRPAAVTGHLLAHFGLSGTSQIGLALDVPESAVLQINGKRVSDGFAGTYFNDIPIVVRATPTLGYTFSHWQVQSAGASSTSLVSRGSVWRYSDTGMNLGTAWQQVAYNDVAWPSGLAQLGYGDGDEATVVGYGPDAANKHATTYFRKSFNLTDATQFLSLSISLLVDDGAVADLNGREIARVNMPSGRIDYTTLASGGISDENAFTEFQISPTYLKSGINILAIEVHQADTGSSDISFDCSLSGQTSAAAQTKRIDAAEIKITLSDDIRLIAFLDADTTPVVNPIVITEINYKSAPEADSEDWVELYNRTDTAIDLTGWRFADGVGHTYAFAPDTVLWPQSYLVLCRDKIKFKTIHPDVRNRLGNLTFGLSPEGESLRLLNAQNRIVDQVDYTSVAPWPRTAGGTGYTIELTDISSDNNRGQNWRAMTLLGTPGTGHK